MKNLVNKIQSNDLKGVFHPLNPDLLFTSKIIDGYVSVISATLQLS